MQSDSNDETIEQFLQNALSKNDKSCFESKDKENIKQIRQQKRTESLLVHKENSLNGCLQQSGKKLNPHN